MAEKNKLIGTDLTQPELPSGIPDEPKLSPPHDEAKLAALNPRKLSQEEIEDIAGNRHYAAISYLSALSVVVLFGKRKSKFAQFHAKQGTVIFALTLLFIWAHPAIKIPVGLALFVAMVIGIFQAVNGFYYKIPLIYDLTLRKLPESEVPDLSLPLRSLFRDVRRQIREDKEHEQKISAEIHTARERELHAP